MARRLTVSEASRVLGLSRTTLLAAEEAGLLTPLRTPGGHRRYDPAELRRYAERAGADALSWTGTDRGDADDAAQGLADGPALAATIRVALRPLAHALDAESAGLYLLQDGAPRFTGAFGVPRWLAERLAGDPVPAPVAQALVVRRPCLFDPADARFPDPRASGQGVAVAVHGQGDALGVLFVVTRRELLAGEVRVVDAFGAVLALLVADRRRLSELEGRLAQIAALSAAPPPAHAAPTPGAPPAPDPGR